jgi:hypothetical protein
MTIRVKAFFFSLLGLALISLTVQSQTKGFAETRAIPINSSTTLSASVAAAIKTCSWYVQNVPEAIVMGNPENLEYIGQDLPLEALDLDEISVFFSGDTEKGDRCSFYDEEIGVELAISVSGTGFYNSLADDSLDWTFGDPMEDGSDAEFGISFIEELTSTCAPNFTTSFSRQALIDGSGQALNLVPLKIGPTLVALSFRPYELPINNPTFADCIVSAQFQTSVPGGKMPRTPGQSYSFQGPTVTTSLIILDSDPS